jgi:Ferritin-like domain
MDNSAIPARIELRSLHEFRQRATVKCDLRRRSSVASLRQEPKANEGTLDRNELIARALVAGGVLAGGGALLAALPRLATSAPSAAQDAKILNFALLLEYVEAGFYEEAFTNGKLTGDLGEYVRVVRGHERQHLDFLKKALGSGARKAPKLDFGDAISDPKRFTDAAIALEETVVAAYNGQAANLTKPTLAQAATIVSVEARHAGWIRAIAGKNPAPDATDAPLTAAEAQAALDRTGFVA